MWTGRQTLASIESAIAKVHQEEGDLDTALRSAMQEVERLRKERTQALRELARVKLDEMSAGRLASALDAGERRAMQLLDDYRLRLSTIADRRDALVKEQAQAEVQRDAATTAVEQTLAAVEAVRTDTEAKVQETPAWQEARRASEAAEAVAEEAEKKAATAEFELASKRKPYDDDPLFVYLWRRKFGTREYDAGNVTRLMDRVAADFIGYPDARPNYAALIEIPLRLKEHSAAKRTEAAERAAALGELERRAMLDLGMEQKERTLAEARHRLAAADQALEDKNTLLRKIDTERQGLFTGAGNPGYEEALQTIAAADSTDDIAALYREAKRTPTEADDALVRKLEATDAAIGKSEAEVARLRRSAEDLARRRLEVEQVRDRFRDSGYDHPNSTFGNDNAIADTIGRVLQGVVTSGVLWDLLRGNYEARRPRGRPDFGGSGFPFPLPGGGGPWSGGEWRNPSSRGGWRPRDRDDDDDDRRDRSGDNDRFTTGGSF